MTPQEILNLPDIVQMKPYIKVLAEDYLEKYGRKVCLTCGSDVSRMIIDLKYMYMNTKFKLKRPMAIYKIEKGKGESISNDRMTDELAIRFLTINPKRIEMFKSYPENWSDLIDSKGAVEPRTDVEDIKVIDIQEIKEDAKTELTEQELSKMKMSELKEMHPEIKTPFGMKKKELIDAIINQNKI